MTQTLNPDLRQFVEEHVGAVKDYRKAESGASRITWFVDSAQGELVVREDSGDGPVANTPLTLAREASVYRALAATNVRIPRLIAHTNNALLMEKVSGSEDLGSLDSEARHQVMNDYVDALADLHCVPVDTSFDALDPPAAPAAAATGVLGLWRGILEARVRRASPLATLASRWLADHAPTTAERLVVCHGDVGPGNFLTDGSRVTALLDWEFVHVGDPMDDLAWLAFRGHHLNDDVGEFDQQLERWQARTGFSINRRRIAYYRVMVMYIWLVSCLAALDNGAKSQDRFTYLNLITLLNVIMSRAMLEFDGRTPNKPEVALPTHEDELTEHLAALADLIGLKWPEGDSAGMYVGVMAHQTLRLAQLREAIDEENRAAAATLMGKPVAQGTLDAALAGWIDTHPDRSLEVLQLLYANGIRRAQASLALQSVIQKPFLPL